MMCLPRHWSDRSCGERARYKVHTRLENRIDYAPARSGIPLTGSITIPTCTRIIRNAVIIIRLLAAFTELLVPIRTHASKL